MQVHNGKYLDAVMLMYNLLKYSDNYEKSSVRLFNIIEMNQLMMYKILKRLTLHLDSQIKLMISVL